MSEKTAIDVKAAYCHASFKDGECYWRDCPQIRDGEPTKTGRSCPLYEDDAYDPDSDL